MVSVSMDLIEESASAAVVNDGVCMPNAIKFLHGSVGLLTIIVKGSILTYSVNLELPRKTVLPDTATCSAHVHIQKSNAMRFY